MNRIDRAFQSNGEARVRFQDGDFQILDPGDFVRCAVTGKHIPLTELRYWNVDLQEAYASSDVALQRYRELRARGLL
ncbi:MAG: DUF2093 domain-containing protein [Hyphomicrobiaceae bacterium]